MDSDSLPTPAPEGKRPEGPEEFLTFGSPVISEDEVAAVSAVLRSGWLGKGPRVQMFEQAFAEYKNARYAVAVSSCTAALHMSLIAAGIGPGDEVITSSFTFCATVNAIIYCGATPVLIDVDPSTMNMDTRLLEDAVTDRTRAVMPVHFAGRPCEMGDIRRTARKHGLVIIEDCAHAVEAQYRGKHCGTLGDFGCFSFYVTKSITTGEGGMVLTRTREQLEKIRRLSLHGLSTDAWQRYGSSGYKHYEVLDVGFKYNMTDMQAALGLGQLAKVQTHWERRLALWLRYDALLSGLPLTLPSKPPVTVRHGYHLYTVLVDKSRIGIDRDEFVSRLMQAGIGTGIHYRSIPEHRVYRQRFEWEPSDYPNALRIGQRTVSLPLSAGMTEADVDRVVDAIRQICLVR